MNHQEAISNARHEMTRRGIEKAVVYQLPGNEGWTYGWDSGANYKMLRDEAAGLSETGWSRAVIWLNKEGNHVGRESASSDEFFAEAAGAHSAAAVEYQMEVPAPFRPWGPEYR